MFKHTASYSRQSTPRPESSSFEQGRVRRKRRGEARLTEWLVLWMEADIVHRTPVARQLVQEFSGARFPYGYALIPAACCDPIPLSVPTCFEKVPLLSCRGTVVCLDPSICRRKRPYIPRANSGVVRVGQEGCVVWGQLQRRDSVGMTEQRIADCLLPEVPDLDIVVDSTREELVASFRQGYRGDRELGRYETYCVFRSRIPKLDGWSVVGQIQW